MSYILDALRKADAQRQRTRLPGLHAQAPAAASSEPSSSWWRSPVPWALGCVLVAALAVYLAWPASQQPASIPVASARAMRDPAPAAATPVVPAPAVPVAPPPAASTVAPQEPPRAATAIEPAPPPPVPERRGPIRAMRSTPDRLATPPSQEAPSQAAAAVPGATAPASASPSAPRPAAPPASSAAPAAPLTETGAAPAGAPKLAISGGVYSANPAQRLLIVGGQVFNEGSEVAPGVVLEQVRPNQALLNFHGQRYTVRY